MERKQEERFCELVKIAIREGAKAAKTISTRMVVVDERVRLKCEVPRCAKFNQYLTCPPHVMSVATFSRILSPYDWCLLIQVEAEDIDSTDKCAGRITGSVLKENLSRHHPYQFKLLNIIDMVEAAAFKNGMRFAAGFTGGECVLCERCVKGVEHLQQLGVPPGQKWACLYIRDDGFEKNRRALGSFCANAKIRHKGPRPRRRRILRWSLPGLWSGPRDYA